MKTFSIVYNNNVHKPIGKLNIERNLESIIVDGLKFELNPILMLKKDKKEIVGFSLDPIRAKKKGR